MGIKNAIIRNAKIQFERGMLTAWLDLDYGDSGQGFGGCRLNGPSSNGGEFITRCMQIADVIDWAKLPGKAVRVEIVDDLAVAIGHIVNNDWFNPSLDLTI